MQHIAIERRTPWYDCFPLESHSLIEMIVLVFTSAIVHVNV